MKNTCKSAGRTAISLALCATLSLGFAPDAALADTNLGDNDVPFVPGNPDSANSFGFPDVVGNEWFATADILGYAKEKGIITGYSDTGELAPYDHVTRGMAVTVLYRLSGADASATPSTADATPTPFGDVDYSLWYGDAIRWAQAAGIARGYEGVNMFDPDRDVTREDLAVLLERYARLIGGIDTASDRVKLSLMPDAGDVDAWAIDAVAWAMDAKLITGSVETTGTYILPRESAQRCALCKMAAVLDHDVLKAGETPDPGPEPDPAPDPKPDPTPKPGDPVVDPSDDSQWTPYF